MNPPPATGTLQTSDTETIRLTNVAARNPRNNETNHFFKAINSTWNTSTKTLSYEPNYHEYDNAPIIRYESSILSNYYPDAEDSPAIPISNQVLVNEETSTITVVALNGSLSTTQTGSVSVEPVPLSAPYEPVEITPEGDAETMTLTIPTKVSPDLMETRTSLTDVSPGPLNETVNITLQGNYTLRTAKIGVGSSTTEPGPRYLTTSEDTVVQQYEEFTVSVRDRFNNPVGDQNVTVTANGSVVGDNSTRVDQSGEVTYTYNGSGEDVNVSIPGGGDEHKVIFDGRSGPDGGNGGNNPDAIEFTNLAEFSANPNSDKFQIKEVQIEDSDSDNDLVRVEFSVTDSSGVEVASRTFRFDNSEEYSPGTINIRDDSYDVKDGEVYTLTVTAYDEDGNSASNNISTPA
ncbi:Ig-like domain-containing protein [Halobacterium sp. KA-4]|uniref:Ig-like domain-containing protein n=1 Tax=Halobacterium sp. KA-4 TaxID=2896367 RepID=UPI001E360A0C|nr:Ig-like domain-containing protein [Halobacterium sp. KA-4]MCD2201618.1 Ig-like domain-containing protein [Halobacterium sp. KA-4]